ncbi:MAG: hypothetical protein EOP50_11865, partial [Sphingobacteriales bacterium]
MKDWLIFLTDEQGRSYTVRNGQVVKVARATPLLINPGGMNEISVGWERSLPEMGITRTVSTPFQYHLDAATILKNFLYRMNVEEKVMLLLHQRALRLDITSIPHTYGWYYKSRFRAEIDPTTIKHEDVTVTASVSEGSIYSKYKANRATVQEVPVVDADSLLVRLDGIMLSNAIKFLVTGTPTSVNHLIGLAKLGEEGRAFGLYSAASIFPDDAPAPADWATDDRYLLRTGQPITGIRLRGTVRFSTGLNPYKAILKSSTGAEITVIPAQVVAGSPSAPFEISFDVTFDMATDERIFFVGQMGPFGQAFYEDSEFEITYKSRYQTTYAHVQRLDNL